VKSVRNIFISEKQQRLFKVTQIANVTKNVSASASQGLGLSLVSVWTKCGKVSVSIFLRLKTNISVSDSNPKVSFTSLTKTQVVWLGSQQLLAMLDIVDVPVLSSIRIQQSACDLVIVIDSRLSVSEHVSSVARAAIINCVNCDKPSDMLDVPPGRWSMRFHYSCLDWCNSLYYGITDELMRRLQSVQNAAARLITGTRRCDHISPVLRKLHWLPVRQRVSYKIVTLVHRCLSGHVPSYLADDCRLVTDAGIRRLCSARHSNTGRRLHTKFFWRLLLLQHRSSGTVCHLT